MTDHAAELTNPIQSATTPSPILGAGRTDPFGFSSAHLVGIGGCGMSAIAWALLECGVRVSGSDLSANENCRRLREAGARIHTDHAAENIGDAEAVIISTAIRWSNPEIAEARARGLRLLHRSEALALFLSQRKSILVTGTHGKTTTSAMAGLVLGAAGLDPWAFVGGRVPAFKGNTRVGGIEWAVAEADESDGSFEKLPVDHLIVTNIENDHLDYWQTPERMMDGYRRVAQAVPRSGIILSSLDDRGAAELRESLDRPTHTYSVWQQLGDYSAGNIDLKAFTSKFDFYAGSRFVRRFELGVPGIHNVSNAVAVLGLTMELGGDATLAAEALAEFHGVGRRYDVKGRIHQITVIDDYAHHPTEVAATVAAARQTRQETGGRLIAVFQPHRYTRTRDLMLEFSRAFDEVDQLILTDIYPAGEDPIAGVTIDALAKLIAERNAIEMELIRRREDIAGTLALRLRPGDVVLTLGAGDNTRTGVELLHALAQNFPLPGDSPCTA